jgi:hypothetical protein
LADVDERKEKWYRRAFFTVFPKLRRGWYALLLYVYIFCVLGEVCVSKQVSWKVFSLLKESTIYNM